MDDDSGQRIVMKSILVREGYTVDVAEDGQKAVDTVQKNQYHVVLMDGLMPKMSGEICMYLCIMCVCVWM